MTAKISGAKVEAFLAALAETGNASLAAEQAGLSRSWVNKARWVDAGLDARVSAARAEAGARLGAARENRPAEGWRMRGGVSLVVTRRGQIARAPGRRRWTEEKEEHFLLALKRTRNLEVSAPAVGMSIASLEKHLRRWPAFRERVERALRLSAGPLAMRLVVPPDEEEGAEAAAPAPGGWPAGMTVESAINTLRRHKAAINDPEEMAALKAAWERDWRSGPEERREAVRARIGELRAGQAARRAERPAVERGAAPSAAEG